jgi:hypothetical protein
MGAFRVRSVPKIYALKGSKHEMGCGILNPFFGMEGRIQRDIA